VFALKLLDRVAIGATIVEGLHRSGKARSPDQARYLTRLNSQPSALGDSLADEQIAYTLVNLPGYQTTTVQP